MELKLEAVTFEPDIEDVIYDERPSPALRTTRVEVTLAGSYAALVARLVEGGSTPAEAAAASLCRAMATSLAGFAKRSAGECRLYDKVEKITATVTATHGPGPRFRIRQFQTALVVDGNLSDRDKARIILAAGTAA